MSGITYFIQECPTCGRRLQVRVTYLGKPVLCIHCRGQFIAADPDGQPASPELCSDVNLLDRADRLLQSTSHWRRRPK